VIAVSSSGKSFRALAAYLLKGRTGDEIDRVAWSSGRNLPTDDPELAATFMRASAAKSDRVEKPVYQIVLSFDPGDKVDRAAMERVADGVLDRLGLREHQAVIVAHQDRAHSHMHVFINRVHPETGKAWERWKDQPLIQEVLREQEAALGLKRVEGTLAPVHAASVDLFPDRDREIQPKTRSPSGRDRAEPRSRIEQLKRDLATYETVMTLSREHFAAKLDADAARARVSQLDEAFERARSADEAFLVALGKVFRDPATAKRAFELTVTERGVEDAAGLLREEPERFGALRTVGRWKAFGLLRHRDDRSARFAAIGAAREGFASVAAHRDVWSVALQSRARRLDEEFQRTLGAIYQNSNDARRQVDDMTRRFGADHAALVLIARPAEFGQLRPALPGLERRAEEIRQSAAQKWVEAARARHEAVAPEVQRPTNDRNERFATERHATREHAARAIARERDLHDQLKRHPRRSELHQRIVQTTNLLLPHEVRRLKMALTAPHLALAASLRSTAREVLLGPDQERQR
jgi:hypothetical protein